MRRGDPKITTGSVINRSIARLSTLLWTLEISAGSGPSHAPSRPASTPLPFFITKPQSDHPSRTPLRNRQTSFAGPETKQLPPYERAAPGYLSVGFAPFTVPGRRTFQQLFP